MKQNIWDSRYIYLLSQFLKEALNSIDKTLIVGIYTYYEFKNESKRNAN